MSRLLNFLSNNYHRFKFPRTKIQYRAKLSGNNSIGKSVYIGDNSLIHNSDISSNVIILSDNKISDCHLNEHVKLFDHNRLWNVNIGKFSYISSNVDIQMVKIGKFCSIGPRLQCSVGNHPVNFLSTSPVFFSTLKQCGTTFADKDYFEERTLTTIGNDVWIGASVTLQSGIHIGDGAIIGNGALVKKDVPDYAIVIGVPAKIAMYRFDEEIVQELKAIKWWDFPDELLKNSQKFFVNKDIRSFIKWYKNNRENIINKNI